jgi:hypothetical protein
MNIIKWYKQLKPELKFILVLALIVIVLAFTGHLDELGKKAGTGGLVGLSLGMLVVGILVILIAGKFLVLIGPAGLPFLIIGIVLIFLSFGGFGFAFGPKPTIPVWGWIAGFILLFMLITRKGGK